MTHCLQDYGDDTIQLMGELIAIHRQWGEFLAQYNWVICGDPDGRSEQHKVLDYAIKRIRKDSEQIEFVLNDKLSPCDMDLLKLECMNEKEEHREKCECDIVRNFKPIHATYNVGALKMMTEREIPIDIKFGLSLGCRFLFPYVTSNDNIHSVLAQLEDCIEQTIPDSYLRRTYQMVSRILNKRSTIEYNDEVQWLRFISWRSDRFFRENPEIFATKSDKGGHTVVIDIDRYEREINNLLNNDVYEQLNSSPLEILIGFEIKLMKYLSSNEKTKSLEEIKRYWLFFQPNVLHLAKFYGLPKVHKEKFSLRPIMSLTNAPSFATGKVFDMMLKRVFPKTEYHIKDSFELKKFMDEVKLNRDDILVSFDVVSMFTSIPRDLVKSIVLEKAHAFLSHFGMGRKILERFLNFLLVESTVFTAFNRIYEQKKGLPMGSCISPTLARITMDRVVKHLLNKVPEITFIKIFVDDTITALPFNSVRKALDALNTFDENIKFTHEMENEEKSINFLNMTLYRRDDLIITNWYRKSFASGRLLNYMSSHKRTTIVETAINFIITTRTLSDGEFFTSNRQRVIDTLRENSFPETLIISLMNEHYSLMRVRKSPEKTRNKFAVYPYAISESRRIRKVLEIYRNKETCYSDSTRNSKINHVKTVKTLTPKRLKGNMIVLSTCVCRRKNKIIATTFNQNAEMLINTIRTKFRKCKGTQHAFRRFKIIRGLAYGSQTDTLAKYIQWQYRGSFLNTRTGRPEYCLANLLRNVRIGRNTNR